MQQLPQYMYMYNQLRLAPSIPSISLNALVIIGMPQCTCAEGIWQLVCILLVIL